MLLEDLLQKNIGKFGGTSQIKRALEILHVMYGDIIPSVNCDTFSDYEAKLLDENKNIQLLREIGFFAETFSNTRAMCLYEGSEVHQAIKRHIEPVLGRSLQGTTLFFKSDGLSFIALAHELTHVKQQKRGEETSYVKGYINCQEIESFVDSIIVYKYINPDSSFYDFAREQDAVSKQKFPDERLDNIIKAGQTHLTLQYCLWNDVATYGKISVNNFSKIREELLDKYKPPQVSKKVEGRPCKSKSETNPKLVELVYTLWNHPQELDKTDEGTVKKAIAHFLEYYQLIPYIKSEKDLSTHAPQLVPVGKKALSKKDYLILCTNPAQFRDTYFV